MNNRLKSVGQTVADWPENKKKAALLVAERQTSYVAIAEEVGVHRVTIDNWRQEVAFSAEVDRLRERINVEVWDLPIADRAERVRALQQHFDELQLLWQATRSNSISEQMLATMRQVAVELGQWQPKQDVRLSVEQRPVQIREVVYGRIEDRIADEERKIEQEVADGTFVPVGSSVGETVEGEWRPAPVLPRPERVETEPQGEGNTDDDGWTQGTR